MGAVPQCAGTWQNCMGYIHEPHEGLRRSLPQCGATLQVTRNESQLTVRQSTAVNPHVVPLVAAKLQVLPTSRPRRQDDWSLTEDDLPRSSRKKQHLKW